jgi:hypothetical protein
MDASFSAGGSFPSHRLGNSPIVIQSLSSGTLPRQIGQKSDLDDTVPCVATAARAGPTGPTRRRARLHASPLREGAQIPPTPRFAGGGCVRARRVLAVIATPPRLEWVSGILYAPAPRHLRVRTPIPPNPGRPLPPNPPPAFRCPSATLHATENGSSDVTRADRHGTAPSQLYIYIATGPPRTSLTNPARASARAERQTTPPPQPGQHQRRARCSCPEVGRSQRPTSVPHSAAGGGCSGQAHAAQRGHPGHPTHWSRSGSSAAAARSRSSV